ILHRIKPCRSENKNLPVLKYPMHFGIIIIFVSYLFQINTNLVLGIDFASQLKSLLQWVDGTTTSWNTTKLLNIHDLRESKETWL